MTRRLRLTGWVGAYVAAVLLPAAVAIALDPVTVLRPRRVEAAAAAGFFAFALIHTEFALVSRLGVISRAAGTDALVQLHQWVGLGAVALAVAHPVLLRSEWREWFGLAGAPGLRSGSVALWAVLLITVTTTLRKKLGLTYETWRVLHMTLAVVAAAALAAHGLGVGVYAAAPGTRALIAGYAGLVAMLVLHYRIARPLHLRHQPWIVVENRDEGASTRTLRVQPDGHLGFSFAAGQFAWLITGRSPFATQQHPLSISSASQPSAEGATIEFSIKALGDWSSRTVPALAPGRRVWVDGPFGNFCIPNEAARILLIAGGIGIAPCRSMLLTMRASRDRRPVTLIYAAHDPSRVIFSAELAELERSLVARVVYVFEEPPAGWAGARGYVDAALIETVLSDRRDEYYCLLCGPPAMLRAVDAALQAVGVRPARIRAERFHVV